MKDSNVTIKFDKKILEKIPKDMGAMAFANFADQVKKEVPRFIPQDTGTLINSHYIIDDEKGNRYFIGYGSPDDLEDRINQIAIYQHEASLNHYGLPGKSMRTGVQGANIPGNKYYIPGRSSALKNDLNMLSQKRDYQKGYRQKRKSGQLQQYSSQFLKRAVEVVAGKPITEIIGNIQLEIDHNQFKKQLKAGW